MEADVVEDLASVRITAFTVVFFKQAFRIDKGTIFFLRDFYMDTFKTFNDFVDREAAEFSCLALQNMGKDCCKEKRFLA